MSNPILTDEHGRPFVKPSRADFADVTSYLRACWAYNDSIACAANRAFVEGFRVSRPSPGAPEKEFTAAESTDAR